MERVRLSKQLAIIIVKVDKLQKESEELQRMTKDLRSSRAYTKIFCEMKRIKRFD